MSLLSKVLYEDCMTFLPECGADKSLYFSIEQDFPLLKWMHNDFMYVRFAGIRNTKTWSKSIVTISSWQKLFSFTDFLCLETGKTVSV